MIAPVAREVSVPAPGVDPFLAATLWVLERAHGALIASHACPWESIHARTLFEAVPLVDPLVPGPVAGRLGLGIVLVHPAPATLEALDLRMFPSGTAWMLLPSPADSPDRVFQDAWRWAQSRVGPSRSAGRRWMFRHALAVGAMPSDPAGMLTGVELWALAVRAGVGASRAAAIRAAIQPEEPVGELVGG